MSADSQIGCCGQTLKRWTLTFTSNVKRNWTYQAKQKPVPHNPPAGTPRWRPLAPLRMPTQQCTSRHWFTLKTHPKSTNRILNSSSTPSRYVCGNKKEENGSTPPVSQPLPSMHRGASKSVPTTCRCKRTYLTKCALYSSIGSWKLSRSTISSPTHSTSAACWSTASWNARWSTAPSCSLSA